MDCPVCQGVRLTMAERSGIEIDYCPQCRGVWLDRGELDKIIERAAPAAAMAPSAVPPAHPAAPPQHPGGPYYYKKKRREGFLGELFDFD